MSQASASPLARALDLEVGRLEKLRLRAWQALSVGIVAASLSLALTSGRLDPAALGSAGVGVVSLGWFLLAHAALVRGRYSTWASLVTFVVEHSVPWAIFMAVFLGAGPEEATHVWGPPLAWTGMLILTVLKLSPRYSILTGAIGGVTYLALSLLVVEPRTASDFLVETVPAGGEAVRAVMLVVGGFVVAVVAGGLRAAVGGVVSTLREQDLFGKYRLERELAAGGMGVVWLATYCPEGGFARAAAVKLVHPHLARDALFVEAFRREAQLCARLVHQNIVQVFDFGRVDERYFLAMELVDGFTLREITKRLAGRAVPPVVAGAILRQVLAGLHFAHVDAHDSDGGKMRVIHRDLAPSNILISKGGEVKLTDFGIARALRDGDAARTQTVAGHFNHMAPEQTSAGALDERTDLFCAGILLWEMLTGRDLFRRDSDAATLFAVAHADVPPPSSVHPELRAFDDVCAKALARDPAARFQSAREMSNAVREAAGAAAGDSITAFLASLPPAPKGPRDSADSQPSTGAGFSVLSEVSEPSGEVTQNVRPEATATIVDKRKQDESRDTTLLDAPGNRDRP